MVDSDEEELPFDEKTSEVTAKSLYAKRKKAASFDTEDENEGCKIGEICHEESSRQHDCQHAKKAPPLAPQRNEPTTTDIESNMTNAMSRKAASFAQLVRSWETYIGDRGVDNFQPLHVFQQLNLCGRDRIPRIGAPPGIRTEEKGSKQKLLEPVVLRHTHSTPIRHTPSFLNDDNNDPPPPISLDTIFMSRSRSTPLTTSANSAFGTILRTMPYLERPDDRSAFLPPYRLQSTQSKERIARQTTFNPIKCDKEMETEEMETESTAIEVMDIPTEAPRKNTPVDIKSSSKTPPKSSSTVSRAARFLSDVRNLRMRRRDRCGRENPACPPSSSEESTRKADVCDEETLSSKSSNKSREDKLVCLSQPGSKQHNNMDEATTSSECTPYHQLDSDHEEGELVRRRNIPVGLESPGRIPSPQYHQLIDERPPSRVGRVRIQVDTEGPHYSVASPEPSQVVRDTNTPPSQDSPGTRCSGTTYTSGHTTHATNTTASSGYMSHLSSISETDREVMEANKTGSMLRHREDSSASSKDSLSRSISLASTRNIRYGDYVELSSSPNSLREGANVPADRFFTLAESPADRRLFNRLRSSSSLRRGTSSHSPLTLSSASTTTNSSLSSTGTEPPTFVSYLDRKTASDLTSLRESTEASSPRAEDDQEERESSPAPFLGSAVVFEEAQAPKEASSSKKPRPMWSGKSLQFGRRVRSLPPRSPHKGLRASTTPPPPSARASPVLSPPRNIVDHRIDPNVSRPCVLRSTPGAARLVSGQKVFPVTSGADRAHFQDDDSVQECFEVVRVPSPHDLSRNYYVALPLPRGSSPNPMLSRTYDERSIEIFKSDSKEDSNPNYVAQEKGKMKK